MELLMHSLVLQTPMALNLMIGGASLLVGAGIAFFIFKIVVKKKSNNLIKEAEGEAEMIKQQKILQAKEKFLQLKEEHEKLINEKNSKLNQRENEVKEKEFSVSQKFEDAQRKNNEMESIRKNLTVQLDIVDKKKEELDRSHRMQVEQLETISGLSAEEAKTQLVESLREEARTEAMSLINEIVDEAKMTANKEAKNIVIRKAIPGVDGLETSTIKAADAAAICCKPHCAFFVLNDRPNTVVCQSILSGISLPTLSIITANTATRSEPHHSFLILQDRQNSVLCQSILFGVSLPTFPIKPTDTATMSSEPHHSFLILQDRQSSVICQSTL